MRRRLVSYPRKTCLLESLKRAASPIRRRRAGRCRQLRLVVNESDVVRACKYGAFVVSNVGEDPRDGSKSAVGWKQHH